VFEMAVPIQSPTRCEVRSVIQFLKAKGKHPAEIHKHIVAVYGDVMNQQNVTKWFREFSKGRTDVHDEQRSGRPSLISDDLLQKIEGEIRYIQSVTRHRMFPLLKLNLYFLNSNSFSGT
jgi:transposase